MRHGPQTPHGKSGVTGTTVQSRSPVAPCWMVAAAILLTAAFGTVSRHFGTVLIWPFANYLTFRKRERPPRTYRGAVRAEVPGHATGLTRASGAHNYNLL